MDETPGRFIIKLQHIQYLNFMQMCIQNIHKHLNSKQTNMETIEKMNLHISSIGDSSIM